MNSLWCFSSRGCSRFPCGDTRHSLYTYQAHRNDTGGIQHAAVTAYLRLTVGLYAGPMLLVSDLSPQALAVVCLDIDRIGFILYQ